MKVVGFVGSGHAMESLGPSLVEAGADSVVAAAADLPLVARRLIEAL